MADKGAQPGNDNAHRGKLWNDALRKAIVQDKGLKVRLSVEQLLTKASEGEPWAIKELADRLDGKSIQGVELSNPEGETFKTTHGMEIDAMELLSKVRGT